ncbi:MAG: MBL fold metallo-hydrolase [Bryobacterales bacterium]|nr:MBL fold metallo-hydrolase [Bryobacterales bacterium]
MSHHHPPPPLVSEVHPGVHRIRLPFHLELNHVNSYLIRLDDAGRAWMLVDAGFGNEESWTALHGAVVSLGLTWANVREVFITHTHPDHWGLAPRVKSETGGAARVTMQSIEAANLRKLAEAVNRPSVLDKRLRSWGTPEDQLQLITQQFLGMRQRFEALAPDQEFDGGETIETSALGPVRAVFTPGHSPGHLCLYAPRERLLISGDHLLPKITPHVAWMEERDALADYRASLDVVGDLAIDTILPGHGDPFGSLAERIAEIKRHHDARCRRIEEALEGGATTPHEIVAVLWPKALSPFNYRFAIYEVMAHLKFMHRADGLTQPLEGAAWD